MAQGETGEWGAGKENREGGQEKKGGRERKAGEGEWRKSRAERKGEIGGHEKGEVREEDKRREGKRSCYKGQEAG